MFDKLYKNIGGKIKNCAKWILVIEAIAAIIVGIILLSEESSNAYGFYILNL